jgi:cytoskeleton protein RodZ
VIQASTPDGSDSHQRNRRFIDGATFGAYLQNHRDGRNLSLRDIVARTKIAERHLAALERGDIRSWPGGIYRRAMVRAYAAAVGLDPETTVCDFAATFDEPPQVEASPSVESRPSPGLVTFLPRASAYLGLVLCAAIAALGWAAARPSDAASAIAGVRVEPVSTVGYRADAAPPTPSGTASPPVVANPEPPQPVTTAAPPQPPAADAAPISVEWTVRIDSEPAGAYVTVNGIGRGLTPITVRHLDPGEKRVRISKDGYRSEERQLLLTHDAPAPTVHVALEPEASPADPEAEASPADPSP